MKEKRGSDMTPEIELLEDIADALDTLNKTNAKILETLESIEQGVVECYTK